MQAMQGKIKKLQSMKNDIQSRISANDTKNQSKPTGINSVIQNKVNRFVVEIELAEKEIESKGLTQSELALLSKDIEALRDSVNAMQKKIEIHSSIIENSNPDDAVLRNLAFLREISQMMLSELEEQNLRLEGSLKGVEKNKTTLERSQRRLSRMDRCIDYFSNSCLISTMLTLALVIILITSVL